MSIQNFSVWTSFVENNAIFTLLNPRVPPKCPISTCFYVFAPFIYSNWMTYGSFCYSKNLERAYRFWQHYNIASASITLFLSEKNESFTLSSLWWFGGSPSRDFSELDNSGISKISTSRKVLEDITNAYWKSSGDKSNPPNIPVSVAGNTDFMADIKYLYYYSEKIFQFHSGLKMCNSLETKVIVEW